VPCVHWYFQPDHVWHIAHRCQRKNLLLKFAKDRKRWLCWFFEAKKRFGLCAFGADLNKYSALCRSDPIRIGT
jgi:hypothetical protein